VKGVEIILKSNNHDGKEGHWLEKKMGIKCNKRNEPDLYGYEMKKESSKISFGDFSASEYLFSLKKLYIKEYNEWCDDISITKNNYIRYFGTQNEKKNNRYSWSGSCVPTYDNWNYCGQNILFNENNDLCIYYLFDKDERTTKDKLPSFLKTNKKILIAIWKKDKLEGHINNKFNKKGFFIVKKIKNTYEKICFGKPFNYEHFVENIKNKNIIFDSGMYEGNSRNYSHFRSSNVKFWNLLIIEEFQ
jgi:hypothetical protein